jgi:acyl-CoA thioesterase
VQLIPQIEAATETGALIVPPEWEGIPGTAFGGFVAAVALDHALRHAELNRPLSIHGRYFRPVLVGEPTELRFTRDHLGRRYESISVDLFARGKLLADFSVQLGDGAESKFRSTNLKPPPPLDDWYHVGEMLESEGIQVPGTMNHVGFEGAQLPSDSGGVHLAARWPVAGGADEVVRAVVMPIDNNVAPGTWNVHGDLGLASDDPVALPSIDLTVWFFDLDVEAGWMDSRTVIPAAVAGTATGRTEVWQKERLIATGTSMVMQVRA